jgi:hypothetical protein
MYVFVIRFSSFTCHNTVLYYDTTLIFFYYYFGCYSHMSCGVTSFFIYYYITLNFYQYGTHDIIMILLV